MIKEILKGAFGVLFWLTSVVWGPPLIALVLIKTFPWHSGMVFSLVSGGFLFGFSVGKYNSPDWVYGSGILLILIGFFFLAVVFHK